MNELPGAEARQSQNGTKKRDNRPNYAHDLLTDGPVINSHTLQLDGFNTSKNR